MSRPPTVRTVHPLARVDTADSEALARLTDPDRSPIGALARWRAALAVPTTWPPCIRIDARHQQLFLLAHHERQRHQPGHDGGDVVLERAPKIDHARRYVVVFWNDDYTTKWFVAHVLEQFFRMNETAAITLMMAIHRHGRGVAGMYSRDIAETKAAEVMAYAREMEMPLKVTAEPDSEPDA